MKKAFALICAAVIICLVGCTGFNRSGSFTDRSFDYFDTVTEIIGYTGDKAEFDKNCTEIKKQLEKYHKLFDIYNEYDGINNIRTVNESDGPVRVDKEIIDLLKFGKEMYSLTGGKANIAMGSVLSIWHEYREAGISDPDNAKLPERMLLENASEHTDIEKIEIDEENGTVTLADPEMSLDVGAVAKGYAVEQVARRMKEQGMSGYIINVGGNVRTVGSRPDGRKWAVGIENPDETSSEAYAEYLSVDETSVVTSGSYLRYYTVDGKKYHHIIDPDTLMPGGYFMWVTVLCADSGKADGLSTALFCMDREKGAELVRSLDGAEAMWMTVGGEKIYSDGFKEYIAKQ